MKPIQIDLFEIELFQFDSFFINKPFDVSISIKKVNFSSRSIIDKLVIYCKNYIIKLVNEKVSKKKKKTFLSLFQKETNYVKAN